MTFQEEISYREELLRKGAESIKLTPEERLWLVTHSVYNRRFGYPFYASSIETLKPKQWYTLIVNVETIKHNDEIQPIILVPDKNGEIKVDFDLLDRNGNPTNRKSVKLLAFNMPAGENSKVKYRSQMGLLGVKYYVSYYDEATRLYKGTTSSAADYICAMKREIVNDHKIRYYCKSPISDSFEAMIFTVEWIEEH